VANTTPNLIKIGQSNVKNPQKIVDTHDTNMEKLKVTMKTISELTGINTPINERVYFESGSADYPYTDAITFTLVNGYTEEPIVTTGFRGLETDFPSPVIPMITDIVQETIGTTADCYSQIIVKLKSDNLPATATARVYIHAECRGAVKRA